MSIDPSDFQYDHFIDQLYNDFREQALEDVDLYDRVVDDFKQARLRDYYLGHPLVIENAKAVATEAEGLLNTNSRASLVLAWTASEVCVRKAIWTPILHGSFHTESSANLVELIVRTKTEGLIKIFLRILAQHTRIDLLTLSRPDSRKTIWEEMKVVKDKRNAILHQAATASCDEAMQASMVAEFLLETVFLGCFVGWTSTFTIRSKYVVLRHVLSIQVEHKLQSR